VSFASDLNPPQREAVLHEGGPLVVFAGAGSGKTRVITHRVADLAIRRRVPPWRILAVTFTNKAAGEMRERLARLAPGVGERAWIGTFHAVCARLLRMNAERASVSKSFTIYDDQDQRAMIKRVLRDLSLDEKQHRPKEVAHFIGEAKQRMQRPEDLPSSGYREAIHLRIFEEYEKAMRRAGALDFGDLIYRLVLALEQDEAFRLELAGRFEHLLVDEFQDTNHAQLRLVRALASVHRNLCVVGDDDQSIYRWRGADRRNILDFQRDFADARVVKLEQNYRSTQRILRAAHAVIHNNIDREPKQLWTENEEGAPPVVVQVRDEWDEARVLLELVKQSQQEGLELDELVTFYRTHAQSRVFEEALRGAGIGYRIVGGQRFYDRAEVKDLLAYLRVLDNPDDDISLLRVLNVPARGIGKTTEGRLLEAAGRRGIALRKALVEAGPEDGVKGKARERLRAFGKLLDDLSALADQGVGLGELGEAVLKRSGYALSLEQQDSAEAEAKLENLGELVGSMLTFEQAAQTNAGDDEETRGTTEAYPEEEGEEPLEPLRADASLSSYLERVSLETQADEAPEGERVTLMTIHAAKGLEFDTVLVTGLEEELFPMSRPGFSNPDDIEEERRLAYVAFTRARRRLLMSHASQRRLFGRHRYSQPSRFLSELPLEDVNFIGWKPGGSSFQPSGRRAGRYDPSGAHDDHGEAPQAAPRPPPGSAHDEVWLDTSDGCDAEAGPQPGMQVRHKKFGVGQVRSVEPGSPPKVRVSFPGRGDKVLLATSLEPA
jgi:DNA helicase-2/ATP-dependent DNA helicase PcrA